MRCKVFIETTVLVASSIYAASDQLGVVKHPFYKISNPLFQIFQKHLKERIGITTFTVEEEARSVLNSAVLETLDEKIKETPEIRKNIDVFAIYSTILNVCSDNLTKNSAILLREPIPDEERTEWILKVGKMYREIEKIDLFRMIKYTPKPVTRRLKTLTEKIYESELKRRLTPIVKFMERRPPTPTDYKILAEAAYLADFYGSDVSFFMASTDQHFAPFQRKETILAIKLRNVLI